MGSGAKVEGLDGSKNLNRSSHKNRLILDERSNGFWAGFIAQASGLSAAQGIIRWSCPAGSTAPLVTRIHLFTTNNHASVQKEI